MAEKETYEQLKTKFETKYGLKDGPATNLAAAIKDLVSGPTVTPRQDLSWKALFSASIDGDWVTLPSASPSFPFSGNKLYIRKDYRNIECLVKVPRAVVRFLILGNPGTGKSCFLIYLLCRLLQEKQTVILHRKADRYCFLFSDGQVTAASQVNSFGNHLDNPNTWYLVDTVTDPTMENAKTVLVCSPRKDHFRQYEKYPERVTLYMPVWNEQELDTVCPVIAPDMTVDTFKSRFDKLGGIPRRVFSRDDPDKLINHAVEITPFDKLRRSIGGLEHQDDMSHVLLHMIPDPSYESATAQLGSLYIQMKVVSLYEKESRAQFFQFLKSGEITATNAALKGSLFEEFAHGRLTSGGTFAIRSLRNGKSSDIMIKGVPKFVDEFQVDDPDPNTYYRPKKINFPCVDAWMSNAGFFQMTISHSHPIKEIGFADLLQMAPENMRNFYFVVPEGETFQNFKWQSFQNKQESNSANNTGKRARRATGDDVKMYTDQVEQFVLAIEFPT